MGNTAVVDNPELVIGLVGPIGVDLDAIIKYLTKSLSAVQYRTEVIHLTRLLTDMFPQWNIDDETYAARYHSLIANADRLRRETENQAALSLMAIGEIRRLRQEHQPDLDQKDARMRPLRGTAYVIRQFKREEEITLLRQVYGRKFIQISVFSDREERHRQLIRKIKDHGTSIIPDSEAEKQAIDLIEKDHNESSDEYGQRVSDVFHLGDVFVRGHDNKDSEAIVDRFIQAFFGHNGYSPTKAEYGMYAAAGAALRSLDLSRQVGAAVFSQRGEVITLGCNEVPKAFGGTYWCDDPGEQHRDFEEGVDGNHSRKIRVVHDLVERLGALGYLSEKLTSAGSAAKQVRILMQEKRISDSRVMDLIEFGRIIHAEMSAITDAARTGKSLADSILYCTTFPCHMCAKHIVSSGVRRVVFLEPYPKSHAKDLHSDSITFSPNEAAAKVLFEPFIGISPRRYRDIFEKKKRKDSSGKATIWNSGKAIPRIEDRSSSYIDNEEPAISLVTQKILSIAGQTSTQA
ncbi:anti-phage dCTP deaminase [Aquamicrobium sp. LC103]|uniref:anti-phage dCTP deaminase n=1 Tax=Aquamicrobium sp. LC103 TaxID=1120658 RepID=UPI0009E44D70|nr:anti-phage dCTP deaminase [Aquamicrobium sp. LC103]TKT69073.1 deoxycytidylate deaminase [Aquamicrobium sp. LC103]